MTLPHFKNLEAYNDIDPIHSSLYYVNIMYNENIDIKKYSEFISYINNNTIKFDLRKDFLDIKFNVNKNTLIKDFLILLSNIKTLIITLHNTKGEVIRTIDFKLDKDSIFDYEWTQEWNSNELVSFLIILKYNSFVEEYVG